MWMQGTLTRAALVAIVCCTIRHAPAARGGEADPLSADEFKVLSGKDWKTVPVSAVRPVVADLTVPPEVCLRFQDGGAVDVRAGVTLTIEGPLRAPAIVRIFRGTGKVVCTPSAVERVYPQWWGAKVDDQVDDAVAIQAAIASRPKGGTVYFPSGNYRISSRLPLVPLLVLEGAPFGVRLTATKALPAMIQRADLTPPPKGIHFNKETRVDGVRISNMLLDGNGSTIGLDLTNVNYTWVENVQVMHCTTGIMLAQLGMYETFVDTSVAYCDTGIEFNVGSMDSNIFGGRISVCKTGILINNTGHLNIYGITFDAYKETGVNIIGGGCVNLHCPWFDSVAPAVAIRIGPSANQCMVVNPRFSGPTPKEIDDRSDSTLVLDASYDLPTTLASKLLKTRALYAKGISGTDVAARNLRGRVTISGGGKLIAVKFATPEPDAEYFVTATCVSVKGDVPDGARHVFIKGKSKTGFDVCLEDAPGKGSNVDVDWILVR